MLKFLYLRISNNICDLGVWYSILQFRLAGEQKGSSHKGNPHKNPMGLLQAVAGVGTSKSGVGTSKAIHAIPSFSSPTVLNVIMLLRSKQPTFNLQLFLDSPFYKFSLFLEMCSNFFERYHALKAHTTNSHSAAISRLPIFEFRYFWCISPYFSQIHFFHSGWMAKFPPGQSEQSAPQSVPLLRAGSSRHHGILHTCRYVNILTHSQSVQEQLDKFSNLCMYITIPYISEKQYN